MSDHHRHWRLLAAASIPALLVLMPVLGLAVLAAHGSGPLWSHLIAHVLPDAAIETLLLLTGTGGLAAAVGTGAAWLVTGFRFPFRRTLEWLLLLPLAMPTYIIAFAYLDVLHPLGPVQSLLRALLGIPEVRGLVLPDIRSLPGCVIVLGFALYPYVYLTVRAALATQAADAIEAARGLGASGLVLLHRVVLPMAAPAIGVGVGLVLMEVLADIGASEFLGVRTLTVAVYVTWSTRGTVEGAAQIALAMLALTFAVLVFERAAARRRDRAGQGLERAESRRTLGHIAGPLATFGCLVPVGLGFALPALHLLVNAWLRVGEFGLPPGLAGWIWNSFRLALLATGCTIGAGLLIAFCQRHVEGALPSLLLRVSALGYALPGTVLAVGLLGPLAWFDDLAATAIGLVAPVPAGLLLSGSAAALVLAYTLRFLAIPANALESAYQRIPPAMDDAARGLGAHDLALARRVHLPLLRPSLAAAALIVLIECMKELPATLLLRPLNVETLATHVYAEAARGTYEDGAVAALAIVVVGLLPVGLLIQAMRARAALARRPAAGRAATA